VDLFDPFNLLLFWQPIPPNLLKLAFLVWLFFPAAPRRVRSSVSNADILFFMIPLFSFHFILFLSSPPSLSRIQLVLEQNIIVVVTVFVLRPFFFVPFVSQLLLLLFFVRVVRILSSHSSRAPKRYTISSSLT
jgi:hypothetical protein